MECLCVCGKPCMLALAQVRRGYKCKDCQYLNAGKSKGYVGRLKRTTETVSEYFKQQGCELLDEYRQCDIPMKYRCNCGNISKIKWGHFVDGVRCGCKKGIKTTIEEVRVIFANNNCELLETKYTDQHKKLKYRCKCGRISFCRASTMKSAKPHCKECGKDKNRGENASWYIKDREALAYRNKFKKKCYSILAHTLNMTGKVKDDHTYEILGYSPRQLQNHIENHPNWAAVKDGIWHLDHIFPIQAFIEANIYDPKLINSLDNLQPLLNIENSKKNAKYDKEKFLVWLESKGALVN